MKNLYLISGITIISALILAVVAFATLGDYVATVNFGQNCSSGLGVGIAFDGENLWYSCYASATDLYRADPSTGQVEQSYSIDEGLGALSYDATRNVIWAGYGAGNSAGDSVYQITLNSTKDVTGWTVAFNTGDFCGLDDGLAFDARNVGDPNDDVIYYSDDCGTTNITVYNLTGSLVDFFTWAGSSCYNSGLAIGGDLLYEGSDGCSHVWVVNKSNTGVVVFNFSTIVSGDPSFRDEDLECDTITFAAQGKHVMWSMEAYDDNWGFLGGNRRAHAFEIPFGSCGVGGVPSGICPETETDTMELQTNRWMYDGTQWMTKLPKGTGPQRSYTIEDTQGCGCKQILDWLHENYPEEFGEMEGQYKYGCSISIMDEFIARTAEPEPE